jgi:hypothetical protein
MVTFGLFCLSEPNQSVNETPPAPSIFSPFTASGGLLSTSDRLSPTGIIALL